MPRVLFLACGPVCLLLSAGCGAGKVTAPQSQSCPTADDQDCDGVPVVEDCDDADPRSTTQATDADCDAVLGVDDCDDEDRDSTTRAVDGSAER